MDSTISSLIVVALVLLGPSSPAPTFHSLAPVSSNQDSLNHQPQTSLAESQVLATEQDSHDSTPTSRSKSPQSDYGDETTFYGSQFPIEQHYRSNPTDNDGVSEVGTEIEGARQTERDSGVGDRVGYQTIEMDSAEASHPLAKAGTSLHQQNDFPHRKAAFGDESEQISGSSSTSSLSPPIWAAEHQDPIPSSSRLKDWFSPSNSTAVVSTLDPSQDQQGPSLTAHYLPTKFSNSLASYDSLDPRRTNSPARVGKIKSSPSSSSIRTPSPRLLSPLFPTTSTRNRFHGKDGQADLRQDPSSSRRNSEIGSPSKPPLSSSSRLVKRGAGRDAWGPDGGGEAALGAGDYEDDDGIDLDWNAGDQYPLDELPGSQSIRRRVKAKGNKATSPVDDSSELPNGRHYSLDTRLSEKSRGKGRMSRIFGRGSKIINGKRRKLRWNRFKWVLFLGNLVLTIYSLGGLVGLLLTWARVWDKSEVVIVSNRTELILGTIAASLSLITSLIGWSGILLNNRAFLSVYAFMLWISFAFIVAPGYISYKRKNFNLEGKINNLWSRQLDLPSRKKLQDSLNCCGYFSPFVEAVSSPRCYSRSTLPGCKGKLLRFERDALVKIYAISFGLVPAHLALIFASLICSNHITYRFGKGIIPKAYRLNASTAEVLRSKNDFNSSTSIPFSDSRTRLISNHPSELSKQSFQSLRSPDSMELPPLLSPSTGPNESSYTNTPLRSAIALPDS